MNLCWTVTKRNTYLNVSIPTGSPGRANFAVGWSKRWLPGAGDTRHCFAIVNGTQALVVALQALDIGEGDEIIVPTLTMSATSFAATAVGAKVVWADAQKDSFTIDPEDVARRITSRTKAVMAVHLYGRVVDMPALLAITKPRGIPVVEDVAEALGAAWQGGRVGGLGTIGCHSFHNKIVASGEGGAITLNDSNWRPGWRNCAPPPDNSDSHTLVLNNRMCNLACAVALAQIERLDELIARRRRVAQLYDELVCGVPGIKTLPEKDGESCVYWRYQIALTDEYPLTKEAFGRKTKTPPSPGPARVHPDERTPDL